jgi:exoribonuclease R
VVVHRLLAAAVGIAPLPEATSDLVSLRDVTANLNYRHRNAQASDPPLVLRRCSAGRRFSRLPALPAS